MQAGVIPLRGRCDDRNWTVRHVVVIMAAWHEGRACVLRRVRHLWMKIVVVSLVRVLMRMRVAVIVVVVVVVIRLLICMESQVSASVKLSLLSRY